MDKDEIFKHIDHTLLAQSATWDQIREICDDAVEYQTASVCIPPSYVKQAKIYIGNKMPVCTVVGFPNGYSTAAVKMYEAQDAIANGVNEIDMMINIGWVKDRRIDDLTDEIRRMKAICGDKILKVIIETCLLTDEEKILMCKVVTNVGADYIKTSTGFGSKGAILSDIRLIAKHIGPNVKIKAAGGISSFEDAEIFLKAGVERLGTSRIIKLAKIQK